MGYLTQMSGLAVQNFVSAAVGIAVAIALVRGFMRSRTDRLGNFWVDLTRIIIRVLLPLSVIGGIILLAGGAVDNFTATHVIHTLTGGSQNMVGGPVASQEVIKEMGNNGGGFYNANSSHPFENPNPFTNWFEIFLLLVIPFSLARTFGKLVGQNRQGYAIASVMAILWLASASLMSFFENQHSGDRRPGGGRRDGGQERRVRHPGVVAVRRVDDGDIDRGGELVPRLVHAVRRRRRAVQHDDGRGRARRGRRRPVRHPRPRRRDRLPRRADGRPHARVHRQEDPAGRDEVRGAVHPHHADLRAGRRGPLARAQDAARVDTSTRARTA